ncbi:hypothetical protein [Singulisphaera sp. PoT]|uniref:hypothetical protein n=1 Tax=Singulisphaera sp. PoT TaxID=3411797 RepID=UPI003BF4FCE1
MNPLTLSGLPPLPLLLWETPPGLELILGQEGIACVRAKETHPLAFRGGRFVLYDGRKVSAAKLRSALSPEHVALDIDLLRREDGRDPFEALVDTKGTRVSWKVDEGIVTERVSRVAKAAIRHRLIRRLRHAVNQAGGVWARLAPFPFPYRSAFNFRADLDESVVEDYARYARARRPLDDCCTHFVSTHAYGREPEVLEDLLRCDTQSHGHYHFIYRDPEANRWNLRRARRILEDAGFASVGFAAPHGRWNPGLDAELEDFGYLYSSDFQLGYDDLPFFPWRGDRFSKVLQIPIHPICEGIFNEAGIDDGRVVAEHLARTVIAKIEAGEPAFVYGHPERRLARYPEVLATLARTIANEPLLWRVTLSDFAKWWHWRHARRWSLVPKTEDRLELQFEEWSVEYPLALEVARGQHVALVPVTGPRMLLRLEDLAYERREPSINHMPSTVASPRSASLKAAVRAALDWETVTPVDDLPTNLFTDRVKKRLRQWRGPLGVEAAR